MENDGGGIVQDLQNG